MDEILSKHYTEKMGEGRFLQSLTYQKEEDFFVLNLVELEGLHCVVEVKNLDLDQKQKADDILDLPLFKHGGCVEFVCKNRKTGAFEVVGFERKTKYQPLSSFNAVAIALAHRFHLDCDEKQLFLSQEGRAVVRIHKDNTHYGRSRGRFEFYSIFDEKTEDERATG